MKSSLFSSILCASLLVFAVGCGKENKSGGGGSSYSNLSNSGLTQTSQQVLQKNLDWFNSTVEGYSGTNNVVYVTKTSKVYPNGPTCEQKKFLGIPYQYCTYSSNPTSSQTVYQGFLTLVSNGGAISSKGNTELNNVFNGSQGTLISAIDVSATASQLDFVNSTGNIVSFIIDRGLHSTANPVVKIVTDSSSKTVNETRVQ